MASINRGDNTGAFGCEFLRIYLNNPNNLAIQKAIFQINGDLEKEYYNPKFPLKVNFTGAETELLQQVNFCRLALWDKNGRRSGWSVPKTEFKRVFCWFNIKNALFSRYRWWRFNWYNIHLREMLDL